MIRIKDDRIKESSSLAASLDHRCILWTMNDDPTSPDLFGIDYRTGNTMATADVDAHLVDTESLSMDRFNRLWIFATGDNKEQRKDCCVLIVSEPSLGKHGKLPARKIPIHYPDGKSRNVECGMVHPKNDRVFLVSKRYKGELFELVGHTVVNLKKSMPWWVTDGTFTHSGNFAAFTKKKSQYLTIYDTRTWKKVKKIKIPVKLQQPESITVDDTGTIFKVGSEGKKSPIVDVTIPKEYR